MKNNKITMLGLFPLVLSSYAINVTAQEVKKETKSGLEVIEVTAQKRVERIQDVPISVNVVNGQLIEAGGITDLKELSAQLPNVTITESSGPTNVFIRGLGSGTNYGFEQSVGMFVDGIYYGRERQYNALFLDIERVEVLRGPQGVLFGKNTIAGAINITTKKPSSDLEGNASFEYEPERDNSTFLGAISIPLTDTLGVRVATKYAKKNGFLNNTLIDKDDPDSEESTIRATFLWEPNDDFDATLKVEHADSKDKGRNVQTWLLAESFVDRYTSSDPDIRAGINTSKSQSAENRQGDADNLSLTLNYQINDDLLFTSISGYSQYDYNLFEDNDFTPLDFLEQVTSQEFDQKTQELRFVSTSESNFQYIFGMYYQTTELSSSRRTDATFADIGFPFPDISRVINFDVDSDTFSLFAKTDWEFNSEWSASFGLRYNKETKDAEQGLELTRYASNILLDPINEAENYATSAFVWQLFGATVHNNMGTRNEEDVSPSVSVRWKIDNDLMFYASASKGFKAGGYSEFDEAGNSFEYDAETANSLEVGSKGRYFDNKLEVNMAAFVTEYKNLQVSSLVSNASIVNNAGQATSQGLELELNWLINDSLTLRSSIALLDANFDKYDIANCSAEQISASNPVLLGCITDIDGSRSQDVSGKSLTFAPDFSGSVSLEHVYEVTDNWQMTSLLNLSYSDEFQVQSDHDSNDSSEGYFLVGGYVSLENTSSGLSFSIIGKNLTDDRYLTYSFDAPGQLGTHAGSIGEPRSISVRAGYSFYF